MLIDIGKFSAVDRRTREGAADASSRISRLTGVETNVDTSSITVVPRAEASSSLSGNSIRVSIGLSGYFDGEVIIGFDEGSVRQFLNELVPGGDDEFGDAHRSAVKEVCNIMVSGYIDGWADEAGTAIEISPPTLSEEDATASSFHDAESDVEEYSLQLNTDVEAVGTEAKFNICLFLERESLEEVLGSDSTDDGVDLDRLAVLENVASSATPTVAGNLEAMTGIDALVTVTHLDIMSVETVLRRADESVRVGVIFQFEGPDSPEGFMVILFDEESARSIVETLVGPVDGGDEDGRLPSAGRSALSEIGNVMASGFVDGWANEIGTRIETSPPTYVHDMHRSIVDDVVLRLAEDQRFVVTFRTAIEADDEAFDCDIYALVRAADLTPGQ